MGVALALLIALVLGGGYLALVRLFPWRDCPRCSKGRVYGGGGHRDCKRCGATGRVRRLGAGRER